MYWKLAIQNIRRSLRDYIIYFVTLTLTAALMYSFLALGFSSDVLAMAENMSMLTTGILLMSALVAFMSSFVIGYAIRFMLGRRKKEFATYELIGMESKTVRNLFLAENSIIGTGAFLLGSLVGTGLSGLLNQVVKNMLIGVDHGNKQIKTVHCNPFVSGLKQSVTRPFGQNVLRYQNTYYTLSTERIPYRKDKTEDDRFFILTLFALAGEIEARGAYSSEVQRIQLAVGLPPAHFGAQVERFTQYFRQRGVIEFEMQGKPYSIYIEDAACFPQAYAAAATMLHTLVEEPKAVILDIGGFTADYLLMKNGEIDLTSCDSLENGVILLYNKVRSKVNSELDLLLDEGDVDAILMGKKTQYPDAAIRLTEQMTQEFINDLFSTLRERMLDLQYCKVVFVGGGAILLKRQIETSGKVGTPFFVPKINANADGYEYLYRIETAGR